MLTTKNRKKVEFLELIIIYEVGNSKEDKLARNGLQELRDRHRFQKRIKNIESILNIVLNQKVKKIHFDILPFNILYLVS